MFAVAAIFMFHHVAAHVAPGPYALALTTPPAEFARELRWLQQRGCATRTVSELVAETRRNALRGCEVALSFDDGYADAAEIAAPMLSQAGDAATFYITTGEVGRAGHVTQSEVGALAKSGMEIGAHTVSHRDLTALGPAEVRYEVGASKHVLEGWLHAAIASFAYPSGQSNPSIERAVRDAGYDDAVTTLPGVLTEASTRDPFALPRYRMLRGSGVALLDQVLGAATRGSSSAGERALRSIARARAQGNDPRVAERVARVLLEGAYPEQILKVRVLKIEPAEVAGIMLSGVKFHRPVSAAEFAVDAATMIDRAFAAAPQLAEVDIWAVVPRTVALGALVSGDLAVPTMRTVFSAALTRAAWRAPSGAGSPLGETFWDAAWRGSLVRE